MLTIKIFDVDHSFCAAISTGNRPTVLIDSGDSSRSKFKPANYLLQQNSHSLDYLIASAYTEEPLSSLSDFLKQSLENGLSIHSLVANPSIHLEQFRGLDALGQRLGNALEPQIDSPLESSHTLKINQVEFSLFWNSYPTFKDAKNLSLVTFISYQDIHVVLPSDLGTEGWQALLDCEDFRDRLRRVNIFVASDHGQEAGYCPAVFDACKPELILISSQSNQKISPELLDRYRIHAQGSPEGVCDKKLLITQEDGTITISKCLDRLRQVKTQRKAVRA